MMRHSEGPANSVMLVRQAIKEGLARWDYEDQSSLPRKRTGLLTTLNRKVPVGFFRRMQHCPKLLESGELTAAADRHVPFA